MMVTMVLVRSTIRNMPDTIDYSKSITIPSNIVREIWYWLEGRRNPDDPIKPVTITISETGIGQTIKVFHGPVVTIPFIDGGRALELKAFLQPVTTGNNSQISISAESLASVQALGRALTSPDLKGSTFVVAGHTDGAGGESYNQDLSERRADSINLYLVEKNSIAATRSEEHSSELQSL